MIGALIEFSCLFCVFSSWQFAYFVFGLVLWFNCLLWFGFCFAWWGCLYFVFLLLSLMLL